VRTRLRKILAAIAASVALTGPLTPAAADTEPFGRVVCGPSREAPHGLVKFCAKVEGKADAVGRTGEYFVREKRMVWSDQQQPVAKACLLHGKYPTSDGIEATFIGFPQFRKAAEVFLPGTQFGTVDGARVARVAIYSLNDKLVYPTGPWQTMPVRGDQYPPSGTVPPPRCDF
jgi:hypothetical protein